MKLLVKNQNIHSLSTNCIVIALIDKKLSSNGLLIDEKLKGELSTLVKNSPQLKTTGGSALLHTYGTNQLKADSVFIINLGSSKKLSHDCFKTYWSKATKTLKSHHFKHITIALNDISLAGTNNSIEQYIFTAAIELGHMDYAYTEYKSSPKSSDLSQVVFYCSEKQKKKASIAVKQASAMINAINLTKDLGNCPPNICTPAYLAKQAKLLEKAHSKISAKVLNDSDLKKMGANTILAVGKGSVNKPKLITMEYKGAAKTEKPFVFVGKGITFDTGGNNIKTPFANMLSMKYDMCGAATVYGVVQAAAELKLPINVVGVVAAAENMPGGDALKPSDIVTSLSGKTVEIINTDAEGRLVLCDALTYVEKYKPKAVIDIATLTGAMIVALGNKVSGLFSNNQKLADKLIQAGQSSRDKVWQMPIWDDYKDCLHSDYADVANLGAGQSSGSINAACYLSVFAEKYPWAHLDVAGTATAPARKTQQATGRPVRLLVEYLLQQS